MESKKLGSRFWLTIALVGFVGQLAWAIENNYINLWVYSQTGSASGITWMTISSAIAATLTTIFMGTLSDRLGKRRLFISIGYIVWGLTVFSFGLLSYDNMFTITNDKASAILLVGISMTIADCVMTFFGSTSNDAAFNAMVTDDTDTTNRGKVESFLSIIPLVANIAMLLIGLPLHVGSTAAKTPFETAVNNGTTTLATAMATPWLIYFIICGGIVTIIGIVSFFLIPKDRCVPNRNEPYLKKITYGFRPSVIKANKNLFIALLAFMCFNSAINAFMPYYLVYFQAMNSVGSGTNFYIGMGSILLGSSLIAGLTGIFMDKIGKLKLLIPGVLVAAIGCLCLFFSSGLGSFIASGIVMMSGYLVATAVLGATVRDETPRDDVGLFQGVRMVFAVLVPMVAGPLISQAFFTKGTLDQSHPDLQGLIPNANMFLVSLVFFAVSIFPIAWLLAVKKPFAKKPKETAS